MFSAALAVVAALYFYRKMSPVILFWAAFILTRPFGAVFGNLFDKPVASGGFGIDRFVLTGSLIVLLVVLLMLIPQTSQKGALTAEAGIRVASPPRRYQVLLASLHRRVVHAPHPSRASAQG